MPHAEPVQFLIALGCEGAAALVCVLLALLACVVFTPRPPRIRRRRR